MEEDELRKKAEDGLKGAPKSIDDLSKMRMNELIHEFRVHQKELEMQNDELRELQYRLEEVRDQYTDLFDFAPVGYFILDQKGIIVNTNLTACSMLNVERNTLKNTPFTAIVSQNEEGYQKFYNHLRAVLKSDKLQSCVIMMNRRKDQPFYAQLDSIAQANENGQVEHCRVVLKDITSERKAESDIKEALEKKIELSELKLRFVNMASHQFRTPITTILSSANLIDKYIGKESKFEKQKSHVGRIKSSALHLNAILNKFLSMDKLDCGMASINKIEFDISEVATNVIENFELMTKKNQFIRYEHIGFTKINMDKTIIYYILNNLLSNAIKYSSEDSEIIFKTALEKDILIISVEDAGIGIPKEDQEHLFGRFYRAKNVTNIEGMGLGLNIIKHYISLLGGMISFESELDKGSKFTVSILV